MTTIVIDLSDESAAKLRETADRLGLSPEELARVGIEELLSRPGETFVEAINTVLDKNAELYRRLA